MYINESQAAIDVYRMGGEFSVQAFHGGRHKSDFWMMSEFNNDSRGEMSDPGKKIAQIKARYL